MPRGEPCNKNCPAKIQTQTPKLLPARFGDFCRAILWLKHLIQVLLKTFWSLSWHFILGEKKIKRVSVLSCPGLTDRWRQSTRLGAWGGNKKTPQGSQRAWVFVFDIKVVDGVAGYLCGKVLILVPEEEKKQNSKGEPGSLCIVVRCHPVLIVNRSDSRRSSLMLRYKKWIANVSSLILWSLCFTLAGSSECRLLTFSLNWSASRVAAIQKLLQFGAGPDNFTRQMAY